MRPEALIGESLLLQAAAMRHALAFPRDFDGIEGVRMRVRTRLGTHVRGTYTVHVDESAAN